MKRNSNFELLRILSMFMIVVWHIIIHGNILQSTTGVLNFISTIILYICIVHVNCFILITGYHLYNKKIKYKKVIMLILEVIFYNIFALFLLNIFNLDFKFSYSIFSFKTYWFLSNYLILYFMTPFINKLISVLSKQDYVKLLVTLSIIFFIIPTITHGDFLINNGYNIEQFIILYLLGVYIAKYDFNPFKKFNLKQQNTIYILLIVFIIIFRLSFYFLIKHVDNLNMSLFMEFADYYLSTCRNYSNMFVVVQSVLVLLLFKNFTFKCKYINEISKTTLGIYLLHDNVIIRTNIYKILKVDPLISCNISTLLITFLFTSVLIFLTCSLIERIRQALFDDRKYYNYVIDKIVNFLDFSN